MICHLIEDSSRNPLALTPPPKMKDMNRFHSLEIADVENPIERGLKCSKRSIEPLKNIN